MFRKIRSRSMDFTVPATAGQYAPEVMYLRRSDQATQPEKADLLDLVEEVQALVVLLPTGASFELELLKPASAPSGTWRATGRSYSTTGLKTPEAISRWLGVRFRAKSGGTAGTATLDAHWWGVEE